MTTGEYVGLVTRMKDAQKAYSKDPSIANLMEMRALEKKVELVDTSTPQIKDKVIRKKKEIPEFGKCCDYLNAIVALTERSGFQEREKRAIKTLAIECGNTLTKLKEK